MTAEIDRTESAAMDAIVGMDTPTLKAELANALRLTAERLRYLAAIWAELERRGEDLSALRYGMGKCLSRIAAGSLRPEIVVAFSDQPRTLDRIAVLPLASQQTIIVNGAPEWSVLVEMTGGRRVETKKASGKRMDAKVVQSPIAMASSANSRDVAEMILKMIQSNGDPGDIARRLLPDLERMAKVKAKRPLSI